MTSSTSEMSAPLDEGQPKPCQYWVDARRELRVRSLDVICMHLPGLEHTCRNPPANLVSAFF